MKNNFSFKQSVRAFLLLMSLAVLIFMADNSVWPQLFISDATGLIDLQNIDIEETTAPAPQSNLPLKESVGLSFDWTFAAKKGHLRNSLRFDYYNLKESADYCIRITNGNCLSHGTQVENWFLYYRYYLRNSLYWGINIGVSEQLERVEFVSDDASSCIACASMMRKGASPYDINYTYQPPSSGFTLGFHYNYAVADKYEFDDSCSEGLNTSNSDCSTQEPTDDEHLDVSYSVFGRAIG